VFGRFEGHRKRRIGRAVSQDNTGAGVSSIFNSCLKGNLVRAGFTVRLSLRRLEAEQTTLLNDVVRYSGLN
jgi:hypothetical protein